MAESLATIGDRESRLAPAGQALPDWRARPPAPRMSEVRLWWPVGLGGILGFAAIWAAVGLAGQDLDLTTARWLAWAGLAAIVVPVAARLAAADTPRTERLLLVLYLAALSYAVKVVGEPGAFVVPEELAQLEGVRASIALGHLADGTLPGGPGYPGLAAWTTVLSQVTGVDVFAAGTLVVGLARLLGAGALFALLERLTGSGRLAGIGVVIYAANANWFSATAQFVPGSLGLPLLLVTLLCVLRRDDVAAREARGAWTGACVLLIAALAATDPVASVALAGILWALVLAHGAGVRVQRRSPVDLAVLAALAAALWLSQVADTAGESLGTIFGGARAAPAAVAGLPALLSGGATVPLDERLLFSLAGVLCVWTLLVAGVARARPIGIGLPATVVVAVAGPALLAAHALRLFPATWGTVNLASELAFVAVAVVGAPVVTAFVDDPLGRHRLHGLLVAVGAFVIVAAGVVIGQR